MSSTTVLKAPAMSRALAALGPFIGLLLVVGLFSLDPTVRPIFLTVGNASLVATQTVIVALGALGMTLIIISGGIDLSVGSVIALTGVVSALLLSNGRSPIVALLAAVAAGGIVGAVNGGSITSLRVTPFIVTLGTLGIARGVAKWIAQDGTIDVPQVTWLNKLLAPESPVLLHLPSGVWMTIVLAVLTALMLKTTVFGRYTFAIGSNEIASRLSGLRVDALKIAIYATAGLFFGLAGVLQTARLSQGDPTVATGLELDVIAAVVIGGGSLSGGEGSVLGSLIGALIMGFLRNGSQIIGWPDYTQQIIIGAVIVVAVAIDRIRHRRSN